ncbi:MAG: zinc-dependent metalloprotease, partial [Acidimicrobiia bacterium]
MSRIPWPLTVRVAGRVAGRHPLEGTYHMDLLADQAPELMGRAAELVSQETGLEGFGTPEVVVATRQEWAGANVDFLARVLGPAEERLFHRFGDTDLVRRAASAASARLVGAEMGT